MLRRPAGYTALLGVLLSCLSSYWSLVSLLHRTENVLQLIVSLKYECGVFSLLFYVVLFADVEINCTYFSLIWNCDFIAIFKLF